jgi:hypothetical protein
MMIFCSSLMRARRKSIASGLIESCSRFEVRTIVSSTTNVCGMMYFLKQFVLASRIRSYVSPTAASGA